MSHAEEPGDRQADPESPTEEETAAASEALKAARPRDEPDADGTTRDVEDEPTAG